MKGTVAQAYRIRLESRLNQSRAVNTTYAMKVLIKRTDGWTQQHVNFTAQILSELRKEGYRNLRRLQDGARIKSVNL